MLDVDDTSPDGTSLDDAPDNSGLYNAASKPIELLSELLNELPIEVPSELLSELTTELSTELLPIDLFVEVFAKLFTESFATVNKEYPKIGIIKINMVMKSRNKPGLIALPLVLIAFSMEIIFFEVLVT